MQKHFEMSKKFNIKKIIPNCSNKIGSFGVWLIVYKNTIIHLQFPGKTYSSELIKMTLETFSF